MSKNQLTKDEFKVRVLKLKDRLYKEFANIESKNLTQRYLNQVIDIIEYRY